MINLKTYEDSITKSICESLEQSSLDWEQIESFSGSNDLLHYKRKDGISIAIFDKPRPSATINSHNTYYSITSNTNNDLIWNSFLIMKKNHGEQAKLDFLHKLGLYTRKEKLDKLNENGVRILESRK